VSGDLVSRDCRYARSVERVEGLDRERPLTTTRHIGWKLMRRETRSNLGEPPARGSVPLARKVSALRRLLHNEALLCRPLSAT